MPRRDCVSDEHDIVKGAAAVKLLHGDALAMLKTLDTETVQTCVTSPPYWGLRDYGAEGQLGLEATPDEYVAKLVEIFREVRRVLAKDGTLWLNLGDSYAGGGRGGIGDASTLGGTGRNQNESRGANRGLAHGLKPKDLVGIPWMVAFALRADGWWLRSDIIWSKPNPMPESVRDRPTKAHEYIFLLAKSEKYYYDALSVKEPHATGHRKDKWQGRKYDGKGPAEDDGRRNGNVREYRLNPEGRNNRSVWNVTTSPYKGAHFATYPPKLIRPCILAGSRPGDLVLDPFNGAGTTGLVALELRRDYVGIDVNADYLALTRKRLAKVQQDLFVRGAAI